MVSIPLFLPWHDFLRHKKQPGPYPWLGRGSFSSLLVLACCEVPSGKIPISPWESLFQTDSTFKESHCAEVLSLFLRTVFHEPKRRVKFKNNLLFLGVLIFFQIYFWKRFIFFLKKLRTQSLMEKWYFRILFPKLQSFQYLFRAPWWLRQ